MGKQAGSRDGKQLGATGMSKNYTRTQMIFFIVELEGNHGEGGIVWAETIKACPANAPPYHNLLH